MVAPRPVGNAKSLDALLEFSQRRRYSAKCSIPCGGDQAEVLSIILTGSVSVVIEDEEGREMIIAYLNPGECFGELGLFATPGQPQRSPWLRARTDCEVAEVSYAQCRAALERDPQVLYALAGQMAQRLRDTTRKVGDLAFFDVTGRVTHCLLDLSRQPDAMTHPDGMQIKITRQEIGRLVGCSREMVGRVLKDLQERSLVQVKGKTMVVHGTR